MVGGFPEEGVEVIGEGLGGAGLEGGEGGGEGLEVLGEGVGEEGGGVEMFFFAGGGGMGVRGMEGVGFADEGEGVLDDGEVFGGWAGAVGAALDLAGFDAGGQQEGFHAGEVARGNAGRGWLLRRDAV